MPKTIWTMRVPVFSTAHLPSAEHLAGNSNAVAYDCGWFVRISDFEDDTILHNVHQWMQANGFENEHWARFDSDGDVVTGLDRFDW